MKIVLAFLIGFMFFMLLCQVIGAIFPQIIYDEKDRTVYKLLKDYITKNPNKIKLDMTDYHWTVKCNKLSFEIYHRSKSDLDIPKYTIIEYNKMVYVLPYQLALQLLYHTATTKKSWSDTQCNNKKNLFNNANYSNIVNEMAKN